MQAFRHTLKNTFGSVRQRTDWRCDLPQLWVGKQAALERLSAQAASGERLRLSSTCLTLRAKVSRV